MKRLVLVLIGIFAFGSQLAWSQAPLRVTQGAFEADVVPLEGQTPATTFYDYRDLGSRAALTEPGRSVLFFHRDGAGRLSLVAIHGPPALDVTNATGIVRFILTDLPEGSALDLLDDPDDTQEFAPPVARLRWKWHTGRTDGIVIGGLGGDFAFKLAPHFIQGVSEWVLLSRTEEGHEAIPLPSLAEPLQIAMGAAAGRGARAAFSVSGPDAALRAYSPLSFDARDSLAPDGERVTRYEWDFNEDGDFEVRSEDPVTTYALDRSGTVRVTLRVTTSDGRTAQTSQLLTLITTTAVRAEREISTPVALPGSTFRVTLQLRVERALNGLGIEERWPAGWTVQGVRSDGAVLKARSRQWVFPDALQLGETRTLVYDVTVPPADQLPALPADFHVAGTLASELPRLKTAVQGENRVQVATCLATPVALAHLDLERDALDLRLPERITAAQSQRARGLWLGGGMLPGACANAVTLETLQRVMRHRTLELPVDEALPQAGVEVGVRTERTVFTTLPGGQLYLPGDERRFRVALELTAVRDVDSVGITEFIPFRWGIEPQSDPDVAFNAGESQWLLERRLKAGQTHTLLYDVVLPEGEEAERFVLRGTAHLPDSPFAEVIEGDAQVSTVMCLDVLVAVAHWDLDRNEIDLELDNLIQLEQARAAMALWLDGGEIPGTCGAELDFATVQRITSYAVSGTPVDQPL